MQHLQDTKCTHRENSTDPVAGTPPHTKRTQPPTRAEGIAEMIAAEGINLADIAVWP